MVRRDGHAGSLQKIIEYNPKRRARVRDTPMNGRISRRGDALGRTLMYEADVVILTRLKRVSSLKDWGLYLS